MEQTHNSQTGFATVHEAKLYYETAGQGDSILLLHAGVADSRMWDAQFEAFAQRYQIIRYDLRGFGRSLMPSGTFAHHEDVAGVLDFVGVDKTHVLGASFGGAVALDFTLAYPERVSGLVLCAPNVSGYEPSTEELIGFWTAEEVALERGDIEAATELNVRLWVDGPQRQPEQVDAAVREQVRDMQRQAFMIPVPEGVEEQELLPPAIELLAEIHVPTLIIVGEQDVPEFIELADIVAQGINGAEKVM
ncbi:MAG: alpha/beta fold hydrolase, partial [Chloroflexales bacterium]|nr:alpha/beta fold hydrolase [Chloroflexales bacterium]